MSGSVANFVTTTRNGKNVVRSKAFNIRNANSAAQLMQRGSFKLVGEEYVSFGGLIEESFPERPENQTAYNSFMAENLPEAVSREGEVPVIDYSKLVIAKGSLSPITGVVAQITPAGISISYRTNVKIPSVNADDQVVAVAKTVEGELLLEKQLRTDANASTLLIDYPGIAAADVKCCYVFVLNAAGTKASRSVFVPLV